MLTTNLTAYNHIDVAQLCVVCVFCAEALIPIDYSQRQRWTVKFLFLKAIFVFGILVTLSSIRPRIISNYANRLFFTLCFHQTTNFPGMGCKGRETLHYLCEQIPGDALLYSMFKINPEPIKCPLAGKYTTHSRNTNRNLLFRTIFRSWELILIKIYIKISSQDLQIVLNRRFRLRKWHSVQTCTILQGSRFI